MPKPTAPADPDHLVHGLAGDDIAPDWPALVAPEQPPALDALPDSGRPWTPLDVETVVQSLRRSSSLSVVTGSVPAPTADPLLARAERVESAHRGIAIMSRSRHAAE